MQIKSPVTIELGSFYKLKRGMLLKKLLPKLYVLPCTSLTTIQRPNPSPKLGTNPNK